MRATLSARHALVALASLVTVVGACLPRAQVRDGGADVIATDALVDTREELAADEAPRDALQDVLDASADSTPEAGDTATSDGSIDAPGDVARDATEDALGDAPDVAPIACTPSTPSAPTYTLTVDPSDEACASRTFSLALTLTARGLSVGRTAAVTLTADREIVLGTTSVTLLPRTPSARVALTLSRDVIEDGRTTRTIRVEARDGTSTIVRCVSVRAGRCPGTLDPSFARDGVFTLARSIPTTLPRFVWLTGLSLSSSAIYATGLSLENDEAWYNNQANRALAVKLDHNGALVTSYGAAGVAEHLFDNRRGLYWSSLLDARESLFIVGSATGNTPRGRIGFTDQAVVKLAPDGAPDTSFGARPDPLSDARTGSAVLLPRLPSGTDDNDDAWRALLVDEALYLVGSVQRTSMAANDRQALVRRLNAQGEEATAGAFSTPVSIVPPATIVNEQPSSGAMPRAILRDRAGRLVIAGSVLTRSAVQQGFVARMSTSGVLDPSWGTNGVTLVRGTASPASIEGGASSDLWDVAERPALSSAPAAYVVAGRVLTNTSGSTHTPFFALLDQVTGAQQTLTGGFSQQVLYPCTTPATSSAGTFRRIVVRADGGFYALGYCAAQHPSLGADPESLGNQALVVAFEPDGSLTPNFGTFDTGYPSAFVLPRALEGTERSGVHDLQIDREGRLVIAGSRGRSAIAEEMIHAEGFVARLWPAAPPSM